MTDSETQTSIEINFSPLLRRYTLEEFLGLPEREDHARYNLIGGFLFIVPPPNPPHGDVASHMLHSLVRFVVNNNVEGNVHYPHEAIYIESEYATYLEPDLMYVSKELREKMGAKRTSADLVFEFSSRRTLIYDHTTKPIPIWRSAFVSCGWSIRLAQLSRCVTPAKLARGWCGTCRNTHAGNTRNRACSRALRFRLRSCLRG